MKKLFFYAAALCATVACTEASTGGADDTVKEATLTVTTADADYAWADGDALGCYITGTSTINEFKLSSAADSQFKGTAPADSFRLIYPYDAAAAGFATGSYTFDFASQASAYMVSSTPLAANATTAEMEMINGALELAFTFTKVSSDDIKIAEVTLNNVASSITVDLNEDASSDAFVTSTAGTTITLEVTETEALADNAAHAVTFAIPATTFSEEVSATVVLKNSKDETKTINVVFPLEADLVVENGATETVEATCDINGVLGEVIFAVWDGSVATSFAGGTGTEADPFQISTGAELAYLKTAVNGNTMVTSGKYFVLTDNIDLNNINLDPIGTFMGGLFTGGVFDGAGFKIINFTQTTSDFYCGLFGAAQDYNQPIMDEDGNATGNYDKVPAVIKNVSISGDFKSPNGGGAAIVGTFVTGGTVLNCSFTGTIEGGTCSWDSVGSIVGDAANNSLIANCYSDAKITIVSDQTAGMGGIVGTDLTAIASSTPIVVKNCYFAGSITGVVNKKSGGVVGIGPDTTVVENCYSIEGAAEGELGKYGTVMTADKMKEASFVETLNANAEAIEGAATWVVGEPYPALEF